MADEVSIYLLFVGRVIKFENCGVCGKTIVRLT